MTGQLHSVLGRKGSGKTLLLAMVGLDSNRPVYSNFKLNIKNYHPLTISTLLSMPENATILIDEAYTWLESRVSSAVLNRYMSYVIFQLRKTYSDMYLSAQKFHSLDRRARDETNVLIKCERKNNGVLPEDRLQDRLNEKGYKVPYYYFWDFKYSFMFLDDYNVENQEYVYQRYILRYEKATKYFDKFDTHEIIEPAFFESMELELLKDNPKRLFEKAKKVSNVIMKDVNEITRETIRIALIKNGFSDAYEPYVYNLIKNKVEFK